MSLADLNHLRIQIAAAVLGEVEQHGAVAGDVLHQRPDDAFGIHVSLPGLVVPVGDGGFGLE